MRTLAIDIGGTKTAAGLVERETVLEHDSWPSPSTAPEAIETIVRKCTHWARGAQVAGVAFGGQFDFGNQVCIRSMHTAGWDGLALSQDLEDLLGLPVIVDNDANVAAIGEYGAAGTAPMRCDPLLYVTVSTGLGAAIIANGELLRGAHSLAGELGHLPIGHEKACNCGQRGCLERAVSGYWIAHDHGAAANEVFRSSSDIYETWITDLARGMWSATLLLDPALIVLGGGMAAQGTRLIKALQERISDNANMSGRSAPIVKGGDHTGRTVLLGAALIAKEVKREPR